MEEIREQMSAIEDPRHQSYVKYPLADILIIIMCAVLSGLDTLGDLAIYAKKENQPSLLEDVRLFFEDQSNKNEWEICQTVEKNAGRNEKRICRKIKDISWMKEHKSSRDTCAKQLMELARKHWKIESMHWILDVTFSEDDCRFLSENAHKSMNALRKFALAVHKIFLAAHHKKSSIKASMLSTLLDSNLLHFL